MNLKTSNAFLYTSPQRRTKPNGRHHELIRESSAFVQQQTGTRKRALYIDQIRALMVALVIAIHVPAAFTVGWFGVRIPVEESVSAFTKGFFSWYGYAINSFIMYMMFLLSGYFVPRSVHKKGIISYLKERLIRLGIPFTAGLLLINNASTVLGKLSPSSPLAQLAWNDLPLNKIWVLWFLIVLFAFDLIYCSWVALRGNQFAIDKSKPTPGMHAWLVSAGILGIIEVVMAAQTDLWSTLLRSNFNGLGAQGMHIFTYAFMFFLGCKASFHRWFERLDAHLVVKWFRFSVLLLLSFLSLCMTLSFNTNLADQHSKIYLLGKFLQPFIAMGILSYLILWFQRNEDRFGEWLAIAGVNSYGAYIIHSIVLVIVLMAVGFIGLNPWLMIITATSLTTIFSFAISGQLRRIPTISKII